MSGRGWHILGGEGGALTLCRAVPPRFDVVADTHLPGGCPLRLAHQIRQDLWRRLQGLRGFSPVVALDPRAAGGWHVRAGGRALPPLAPGVADRIGRLLDCPAHRARWLRHAGWTEGAT